MAGPPGVRLLISDFLAFSRRRSATAIALIAAGAVLEGAGVMMLVPIASLIINGGDTGELVAPLFAVLGLATVPGRIGGVLAVFGLVLALRFFVLLWRDDLLTRLHLDFVADLRIRAFGRLARTPWAELAELQQGPVGHALARDVERASYGATLFVHGGIAMMMLLIQSALAFALAPAVTLIVVLLGLGLFRALRWLRDRAEHQGHKLTSEDLTLFQSVGAFLRGLKPAKAHGIEGTYVAIFERAAASLAEVQRASALDFSIGRLILQTASGAIAILAILIGLFVLATPPESLIVTLIILVRLYGPLQTVQNTFQAIRHAAPGYRATREIAGPAKDFAAPFDAAPSEPLEVPPGVSLDTVCWHGAAPEVRPVLDGVSAEIPAGRITALIGESGAGKSTLCDLAVGLLTPSSGEVRLDGVSLDAALTRRLRASVAYVGQESFLFEDSLRNNLCWGCAAADGPISDAAIWRALETVGAAGCVRALEGGLDGRIRAEGMRFSGGERQRLRLARALLRRPRLLVLDEATNALDLDAESRVLQALFAARDGATVLMVSHRPGNLRLADHVILLDSGRIAETGSAALLLRDPASRVAALLAPGGRPAPSLSPAKSESSVNSGVD